MPRLCPTKTKAAREDEAWRLVQADILRLYHSVVRHIIPACDCAIRQLDMTADDELCAMYHSDQFPQFSPYTYHPVQSVVYNGRSARLHAATSMKGWENHPADVSKWLPFNQRATSMLQQTMTSTTTHAQQSPKLYGDAILVTDDMDRWVLPNIGTEELEEVQSMLRSPHSLYDLYEGRREIIFHDVPSAEDLVYIELRFGDI